MKVWIAEKPNQARDLAKVLGNPRRGDGAIDTAQGRVVYARGHLLEQQAPEHYDPAWEWSLDPLPLVPQRWDMKPRDAGSKKLVAVIREAVSKASSVVIATDPDREGECIARELLDSFRYKGSIERLWLKGLDEHSIRKALAAPRADSETRPLYWAAMARSRADWIWGLSLTRLATLLSQARGGRGVRPVGRVQTPTLYLVYLRCKAIEAFVPRGYFELSARVRAGQQLLVLRHAPPAVPEDRRLYDRAVAEALQQRATGAKGPLRVSVERKREGPPSLFSLSGFQKTCSARFGWSGDKTLSVAQSLYDSKATSYPRTDCPFLPAEQVTEIPQVVQAIFRAAPSLASLAPKVANPLVRSSVWNTAKVTAHPPSSAHDAACVGIAVGGRAQKAYLLIAQHYLACLMPDYEFDQTRIVLDANGVPFSAVGRTPKVEGWKAAFGNEGAPTEDDDDGAPVLPVVPDGTPGTVEGVDTESKQTQPPKPYTEGTLLEDMASVAKFATDPRIKQVLRDSAGLGTEATRAGVIKELRRRGFIEAKGRSLWISTSGSQLIEALPKVCVDPSVTGIWEDRLERIASGELPESALAEFVDRWRAGAQDLRCAQGARGNAAADRALRRRDGPPTPKMLSAATYAAKQRGHKQLPAEIKTSFAACKAYLDVSIEDVRARASTNRPSDRAIEFAQRLAGEMLCAVPPEALQDRAALSAFIDQLKSQKGIA
jgi:DNA topoisomerase-3